MKIVVFGDIYGRVGRKSFLQELPLVKQKHSPDLVIANVENATSGKGPISSHVQMISDAGVDIMTLGDHCFDNAPNIYEYLEKEDSNLIRPANFYDEHLPGCGHKIFTVAGKRILVIQLLGEVFMNHKVQNPFQGIDRILDQYDRSDYDISILDFHRETTAEIQAMAHYLAGRCSLVYGTHTHVQTNDPTILENYTGYISDVGMNGPAGSVIGASFESVKKRFLSGIMRGKIEQSLSKTAITNYIVVDIDDKNGAVQNIKNYTYTK